MVPLSLESLAVKTGDGRRFFTVQIIQLSKSVENDQDRAADITSNFICLHQSTSPAGGQKARYSYQLYVYCMTADEATLRGGNFYLRHASTAIFQYKAGKIVTFI